MYEEGVRVEEGVSRDESGWVTRSYHSSASHDVTWTIGSFHNDCKER